MDRHDSEHIKQGEQLCFVPLQHRPQQGLQLWHTQARRVVVRSLRENLSERLQVPHVDSPRRIGLRIGEFGHFGEQLGHRRHIIERRQRDNFESKHMRCGDRHGAGGRGRTSGGGAACGTLSTTATTTEGRLGLARARCDPIGNLVQIRLTHIVLVDETLRSNKRILSVVVPQLQRHHTIGTFDLHGHHVVIPDLFHITSIPTACDSADDHPATADPLGRDDLTIFVKHHDLVGTAAGGVSPVLPFGRLGDLLRRGSLVALALGFVHFELELLVQLGDLGGGGLQRIARENTQKTVVAAGQEITARQGLDGPHAAGMP
mmetsp:Transcript_59384/g.104478  ORF Transcript_59384/g.104478 Transcript_59384/m.104478 type:complete len:318 (-) Transcript_59384:862-1815(-)